MGSLAEVSEQLVYPFVKRNDSVVEDYHGVSIVDPYHWLENVDVEDVKEFVEAQRGLCNEVLNTCNAFNTTRSPAFVFSVVNC
ncbi:hypothetical protein GOP47_0003094 [Adiantum capillus-veneris]|uniref:Peptidase S9A N-terminal domain-containing protein n=1 Tax=Adiantum capillus-veneris TaxID=13818 RepID=A0A9D4ZRI5_ADICA|nr:hypothetical protein GOP47_0003094 [Adiantum capillus-veneris]